METKTIHMKGITEGKTLCGMTIRPKPLPTYTEVVPNPEGKDKVTCKNCLKLIKMHG